MAQQSTSLSSNINVGLRSDVPETITTPDGKSIYSTMIQVINNLIQFIEQYCGVTQKDITQWSTLSPSDTIVSPNMGRLYVIANVNLSYGHMVNLFNDGTQLSARLADEAAVRRCHGYCNVAGGVLAGQFCEIILINGIVTITGVVRGTTYWLGNAGLITAVASNQVIGFGVGTNTLAVAIDSGKLT